MRDNHGKTHAGWKGKKRATDERRGRSERRLYYGACAYSKPTVVL